MVRPKIHISDVTIVSELRWLKDSKTFYCCWNIKGSWHNPICYLDEDRQIVAQSSNGHITLEQVRLWEVLDAYLYTAHIELLVDGKVVDTYDEPFGVRSIHVADGQFFVNQKPVLF